MPVDDTEIPLKGGNINEQVVRIGDTVRRAQTAHSPTIHRFLNHLETHGYSAAPRFLGTDTKNREILSFLPGETSFPDEMWSAPNALITAANLLRNLHDTTTSFIKSDTDSWAIQHPNPSKHEVICHNDFAPYNMVFNDGVPTGIYDFDLAGPGPRLRDVAYLAYWMVPMSFGSDDLRGFSNQDLDNGSARLKLLCETYGISADTALLDMVGRILNQMSDQGLIQSIVGAAAVERLQTEGNFEHWVRERDAFSKIRINLAKNLDSPA